MSTATNITFNTYQDRSYVANVAHAARNLLRALFAVQPARAAAAKDEMISRDLARDRAALLSMARDFEAFSPSQAAELRYLASRG
ncbi:hypothetical protein [Pseudoduganella violacea]|uniref:Uncharacterized protein n=1 Tax=Pseudoduganella violacea TaxID=1715466 RepID=A0A7W5FUK2_9BURK|nr:hypothetical protein [Pseudoduganella violacea]MBB3119884.1 hypothetical protein [Pseudoduganella violacea]